MRIDGVGSRITFCTNGHSHRRLPGVPADIIIPSTMDSTTTEKHKSRHRADSDDDHKSKKRRKDRDRKDDDRERRKERDREHRKDKDREHKKDRDREHKKDEHRKHKSKSKEQGISVVDDDSGEDMWVEKNVDGEGSAVSLLFAGFWCW